MFVHVIFQLANSMPPTARRKIKHWVSPGMHCPFHDLAIPRYVSWVGVKISLSHSIMAAGTAVMHFPSPRSTVKKEEPARRIQKIKTDEVRILTGCKG